MSIGSNIYTLRKEKKLTQAQLAEKLGVSEQSVSKWENDIHYPDVSLFPAIAALFGVSIDRLFDYHQGSMAEAVRQILKDSENGGDLQRSVEILESGLQRYPNSPELKTQLAHLLFMHSLALRAQKGGEEGAAAEAEQAVARAIALCRDVADNCTENSKADHALNILRNIYCELGDYRSALNAIDKLSPENYRARRLGRAQVLAFQKDEAFGEYTERCLLELYQDMNTLLLLKCNVHTGSGEYETSIAWSRAHEKLAAVFDDGCPGFFLPVKLWNVLGRAQAWRLLGDRENCLAELKRLPPLLVLQEPERREEDWHISRRNPLYFSSLRDPELMEEYAAALPMEQLLKDYDAFFGEDEAYLAFRRSLEA